MVEDKRIGMAAEAAAAGSVGAAAAAKATRAKAVGGARALALQEPVSNEMLMLAMDNMRLELKNFVLETVAASEKALRIELRAEMQALRTELHADMQTLRTELRSDIQALRTELRGEIQAVRGEMQQMEARLCAKINSVVWQAVGVTIAAFVSALVVMQV